MNAIINKTGNVIQKIIWGILVAMFGILSIFNILGTTKIDIKVNDYKEYATMLQMELMASPEIATLWISTA